MRVELRNEAERFYTGSTKHAQAFVFGAPAPRTMWAWAVYWSKPGDRGSKTGVEFTFRAAVQKVGSMVRYLEGGDA